METTILLTPETYNNSDYNDEVAIFVLWAEGWDEMLTAVSYGPDRPIPWEDYLTFQLLVREARKDE